MNTKDILGMIFVTLTVGFSVVFFLDKRLCQFRNIPRRTIINIVAICCGVAVMIPMAIFRPLTSDEEKQIERTNKRKWMSNVVNASNKSECLGAKGISFDVKERVASELRINPALVTLGRMSYDNECVAVLYVPTGMYVCSVKTTVIKGVVSECKARY